jgi:hypothetical protein
MMFNINEQEHKLICRLQIIISVTRLPKMYKLILKMLIVPEVLNKFPVIYRTVVSLQCPLQLATGSCPGPNESNSHLTHHFFNMHFNVNLVSTPRYPMSFIPFVFRSKFCMYLSSHTYVLCVLPISFFLV